MNVIIKLNKASFGNAEYNLQSLHSIFVRTGTSLIIFTLSIYVCAHFVFQNCAYYWGFSAWLAYYINHPLYTPPCKSVRVCHIQHVFLLYFHHIKAKLSFSIAYGELQVNYALILFVVRILIITHGISHIQTPDLFISALDV